MWKKLIKLPSTGTKVRQTFAWTKNIVSTKTVNKVSAIAIDIVFMVRGLESGPECLNAVSAISANHIALTNLESK